MTIIKARKILGSYADRMTDEEIQNIIDCFHTVIEIGFQIFEASRKTKPSKTIHYKP